MAGDFQPLDEKFEIVGTDGRPTPYFIRWAQQRQIDISDAITAEQALAIIVEYLAAHLKLPIISDDNWNVFGLPGIFYRTPTEIGGLTLGDNAIEGSVTLIKGGADYTGAFEFDLPGFVGGCSFAQVADKLLIQTYGTVTAFQFNTAPYVGANKVWHGGNLSFGSNLTYDVGTGVLSASGGVLPVVDGSIPPVFLQNPDGSLIYAPI